MDLAISLCGLLFALPLIVCASLLIRLTSAGPVFFLQKRIGRDGRSFAMVKLRTMVPDVRGPLVTAGDDQRMTGVGRWLRKLKIDELPELWNVIRGEMSLVGPRPEVPKYVDFSDPKWQRVLRARPGIVDPVTLRLRHEEELLASVEGDREQFYMEVLQPRKLLGYASYLEHRTVLTDIGILIKGVGLSVAPWFRPDTQDVFEIPEGWSGGT